MRNADRLDAEEASAWRVYLNATRGKTGFRYEEIETWAWMQLAETRRSIRRRRKALLSKAS